MYTQEHVEENEQYIGENEVNLDQILKEFLPYFVGMVIGVIIFF